jgi:hypothetical protein
MRPPERCSTPALNAFIHSCGASLTVGDDSFMVNCCALAALASNITAAMAAIRKTQLLILQLQFCFGMNRDSDGFRRTKLIFAPAIVSSRTVH